jgi:hypothetical protein
VATEPFIQYNKLLTLPRAEVVPVGVPVGTWPSKPGSSAVRFVVVVGHGLVAVPVPLVQNTPAVVVELALLPYATGRIRLGIAVSVRSRKPDFTAELERVLAVGPTESVPIAPKGI